MGQASCDRARCEGTKCIARANPASPKRVGLDRDERAGEMQGQTQGTKRVASASPSWERESKGQGQRPGPANRRAKGQPSTQPAPREKSDQICKYQHQRRGCRNGIWCEFGHNDARKVCLMQKRYRYCHFGQACPFSHNVDRLVKTEDEATELGQKGAEQGSATASPRQRLQGAPSNPSSVDSSIPPVCRQAPRTPEKDMAAEKRQ